MTPSSSLTSILGCLLAAITVLAGCAPPTVSPADQAPTSTIPLTLSPTGRYLVDSSNQPVFWSGDSPWSIIVEGTREDIDNYMARRQQQGFNVIIVNLIDHKFGTNAPSNKNGDPPFTGAPFTTPNEAYFTHADYVISSAAQHGITVLLDPLYLGFECGDEGWCAEVQDAPTSSMVSWAQYVGNRYKGFDNIVWVIGGDVDPARASSVSLKVKTLARALQQLDMNGLGGLPARVTAFVSALTEADNRHLITAHNGRGQMAMTPWSGVSWLSVNDIYTTYAATYEQGQEAYRISPPKPFYQIEAYYEHDHSMTLQQLRAQAYWTVLSGGMGYMFGNCPLWGFGSPATNAFCPGLDWRAQLDSPGATSMTHVHELFAPRPWQNLVPDWSHTTLTAGYGTFGSTDYATAEQTPDGHLMLAYLPTIRTVTVDATHFAGPVVARWYDPSAGTYLDVSGSPFTNQGSHDFTPVGNNAAGDSDWVLVLETSS